MQLPSPDSYEQTYQTIQDHLSLESIGILWLTDGPMNHGKVPFKQLDYFFDGVLTNFLVKQDADSSFFIGNHFGQPFFLGQVNFKNKDFEGQLANFLNLMKPKASERKKVLVINDGQTNFPPSLLKKFQGFNFDHISLS